MADQDTQVATDTTKVEDQSQTETKPSDNVEESKQDAKQESKPLLDPTKPLAPQVDGLLEKLDQKESKDDSADDKKDDSKDDDTGSSKNDDEEETDEIAQVEEEAENPKEQVELPAWQEYVIENLPNIQTIGHTTDGKDKVFNVKRLEDLPEDFEFANKRAELAFTQALTSQEINARNLLAQYQQQEQANAFQEFKNKEAEDVSKDISDLQTEGILDKFKYEPNDPKFASDPAVKVADEIYDLYEKINQDYMQRFNTTGQTYRISYRDAADKYFAAKAREERVKSAEKVESKDDNDTTTTKNNDERTKVASKISAPQSTAPEATKPRVKQGTTFQDVLNMYNNGRI